MIRTVFRFFGMLFLFGTTLDAIAQTAQYVVVEKSIRQLGADLDAGRVTSEALVRQYLARIEQIDRNGPALHAVLAVNPKAIEQAQALDRERRDHRIRGPLHGIPILLKDNIESLDPMPTTAGSLALKNNQATRDAPIVAQLRAAGAVILGKTNLSEWANFRSEHSTSGWSAVGGLTKNAYVLDRNACGSSSGSGSAVAASLAAAAIGTETDGSITCPASINSLVGLKPTLGLLSGDRIVPIAHSQDTAGPMTRTVEDTAILLQALANKSELCKSGKPACELPNYSAALKADALRGKRIGILRFAAGAALEVDATYTRALQDLRDAGATLIETEMPPADKLNDAEMQVLLAEFKTELNAYLATTPNSVGSRNLEQLIAFNKNSHDEMRFFGQELFIKAQATKGTDDDKYREALAASKRLSRAEGIDKILSKDRLDALVAPTMPASWRIDLLSGDRFRDGSTTYAAVAGYPHITVPMGYYYELPLGLSIIGPPWSEPLLLGLGYAFETKAKARKPPRFLPSIDAALERGTPP
jgi:amidase